MDRPPEIQQNVPLGPMTAYRIGGPAKYYVRPVNRESLLRVLRWAKAQNLPYFIMGAGTNLLVSDRGYPGLVIHLRGFLGDMGEPTPYGEWQVGAGTLLNAWVRRTAWRGFKGVEALIGIPGTVGGALLMNAGAFSQEICGSLQSVEVIRDDTEIEELEVDSIGFSYRSAPGLKGKVILSGRFQLDLDDPTVLLNHLREIIAMRRDRQPLQWPSCGSVFKRPEGDYAGRLIEAADLKGLRCGDAQIAEQHANFIINCGKAKAADVLELIKTAKRRVLDSFGVELDREVILVGFTEEELEGT